MDAAQITAVIGAFLTGSLGKGLLDYLWPMLAGRGARKRDEIMRAWDLADEERAARQEEARARDLEMRRRRRSDEHAAKLRRMLLDAPCVDDSQIPDWPAGDTAPTRTND